MKIRSIGIISLLILLSGCGCRPPLNLTIAKQQVEHYYESGCYTDDLNKIVARSINYFESVRVDKNATVIFDVDDTSLSNYSDEKAIAFGYIPKLSHEWVLRADAPAIPQIKKLYDYLVNRGFKIVFMTGRKHHEHDSTIQNLKREGFTTFEKLIVREQHELKLSAKEYKSIRRKQLTMEGYKIVGCIGDQRSDLEGGYSGRKIKLPNYRYLIN